MTRAGGGNTSLRDPRWIALFFAFGLAMSILMVARGQVAGDQLNHLGRGWHLAMEGRWVPFGPPATKGGAQIGGINGLLVGVPLMVWENHRAPTVVVLLFHLIAYLLLDRLARRVMRPEERFLLALLYWLNPWRLFFSGFLWNPNYLLLAGAVHLWTAWRLKERPRFWASFAHVLALGLAMQVHAACLMLVLASVVLWWRRYIRLHFGGAVAAGLVVAGTLVPWVLAVAAEPAFLPAGEGLPGYGLLKVHPVLKGLAHWFRFPGLALGHAMTCLDFSRFGGPSLAQLRPFLAVFKGVSLPLTLILAGWCNWRLWRHRRRSWRAPADPAASDRAWLGGYVRWTLLATLATFALSPTSISHWYVFPVLHAAILPVVLTGRCPVAHPPVGQRPPHRLGLRADHAGPRPGLRLRCPALPLRSAPLQGQRLPDARPALQPPDVRAPGHPEDLPRKPRPARRLVARGSPGRRQTLAARHLSGAVPREAAGERVADGRYKPLGLLPTWRWLGVSWTRLEVTTIATERHLSGLERVRARWPAWRPDPYVEQVIPYGGARSEIMGCVPGTA